MQLNLCTTGNERFQIIAQPTDTISAVKKLLASKYNLIASKTRIIYQAQILPDIKTVSECGIDRTSCLVLHTATQKKKISKKLNNSDSENVLMEQVSADDKPAPDNEPQPTTEPLPEVRRKWRYQDPPGFEMKVQELVTMGFALRDCEDALRAALYNVDRAADYLLSGNIPSAPPMMSAEDLPECEEEEEEYDDDEETTQEAQLRRFARFRKQLLRSPETLRQFLRDMAEENPAIAGLIRDDPAAFLASIGLNPTEFDLSGLGKSSQYEVMMKQFDSVEQDSIHNLEKLGFDTMTVIQVFVACGKDESLTQECLNSMK